MHVILQDSRERRPLKIEAFEVEVTALEAGDYGIKGFSDRENPRFIVERKSLTDLIGTLNAVVRGRSRFFRQVQKMRDFEYRALLVESTRGSVEMACYTSRTSPESILGRLDAICKSAEVRVYWCGDAQGAARKLESLVRSFVEKNGRSPSPDG